MRKQREALEAKLAEADSRLVEMDTEWANLASTAGVSASRVTALQEDVRRVEGRLGEANARLGRMITKLHDEELRYTLLENLLSVVANATHEHYHTSNLPDHPGYIVREEDMAIIRKLLGELGVS